MLALPTLNFLADFVRALEAHRKAKTEIIIEPHRSLSGIDMIESLHEVDHVASLVADKAPPSARIRINMQGRVRIAVERA